MSIRTQPDDRSTALTRAIGNITGWLGSFPAILFSVIVVLAWLIGWFFVTQEFSNNTYQLLINTGTTIITFWMVFVIQNTQNREGRAMQSKLDAQSEVIRLIAERLGIADDEALLTRTVGSRTHRKGHQGGPERRPPGSRRHRQARRRRQQQQRPRGCYAELTGQECTTWSPDRYVLGGACVTGLVSSSRASSSSARPS